MTGQTSSELSPLDEIISRSLAPDVKPSRPVHWWMGLGTMPSISQRFANQPLLNFVNATFRGVAQVVFVNNPLSGLLIVTGMAIQSPWLGLMTLLGTASATLTAIAIRANPFTVRDGIYGLNGMLIGAASAFFGQFGNGSWNIAWAIEVIILASLTAIVVQTGGLWFTTRFRVSPLSIPFNGVMLPFLLLVSLISQSFFNLGPPPPAFEAGEIDYWRMLFSSYMGLPQIFFSDHPLAIVFITAGVAISSPITAFVALLGGFMYTLAGLCTHAKPDEIYMGLFGYNAVLTAVAIGGVFYPPTRLSITLAAVCAYLASLLSFILAPIFGLLKLPVLSVPFVIVTISCLMIVRKTIPSLVPVALYTVASPEEHLQRFIVTKQIISNWRHRLQLSMLGKKHNFFFEQADTSVKGDLHYIFNAIDQDQNNQISIQELSSHLRQVNKDFSDSEIALLFKDMDSNHSGLIDFEEFGELILRHRMLTLKKDELMTYFLPIDANEDDRISADEMNVALSSIGESPLTEAEITFLVAQSQTPRQPVTWNKFIEVLLIT